MGEWQPIETAPKDQTEVLVWVRGEIIPLVMAFFSREYYAREYGDAEYMEDGWRLSYGYPGHLPESTWEPTHWMPLPEPPRV